MTNRDYLEEAGWVSWHGGLWRDPGKGKLFSEAEALAAQRDYDRPGWEQEVERIKAERDRANNDGGTEE